MKMGKKKNPLVFLDVCIDGDPFERMVFELFSDVAPKSAENFRALCTGEKGVGPRLGKPLHYKGTFFHRIMKGSMAQGGDLLRQKGSAGESIYGDKFPDESPKLKHDEPGLLSLPISDRDHRGSIFNLLFKANHNLDRKNIVFGKLVHGLEVLKKIEDAGDEDGRPAVTVKIINAGAFSESDLKKLSKKQGKEVGRKGKHKKSSRDRRKRRKLYYTSESESSSDTEVDSDVSDSDSESEASSSDVSSSSDDWRKKKKKSSKRDKYRRGKRKDKRRDRKRRRHGKRSRRKSRRCSDSSSETDSESETDSSSEDDVNNTDADHKHDELRKTAESVSALPEDVVTADNPKRNGGFEKFDHEKLISPTENGGSRVNGYERDPRSGRIGDRQPDVVEDHPGKSRSRSTSPKRDVRKSMSISPGSISRSRSATPQRGVSRSPSPSAHRGRSIDKSPVRSDSRRSPARSISQSPARSISRSPARSISPSPARSISPSPARSISRSPARSISITPPRSRLRRSPPRRSVSGSLGGASSRRSAGRSPGRRVASKSSPSPVRSSRRSMSPLRSSHRSISRSSGRAPSKRLASPSPVRSPRRSYRQSYSRSPIRRSPPIRRRSLSRSASPDGSPKRIRRGRGFSDRYSYARRYKTPSPERYRYGARDRYTSYRRYGDRSPRRYRSPRRSPPPRYRSRRSRTRSPTVSRSPPYRRRRYARSPSRSRSPIDVPRNRAAPRAENRPSSSSRSRSRSRSRSVSGSSKGSPPPKRAPRSRSSSDSPAGKKGLVSYGDGSPEASPR